MLIETTTLHHMSFFMSFRGEEEEDKKSTLYYAYYCLKVSSYKHYFQPRIASEVWHYDQCKSQVHISRVKNELKLTI